MFERTGAAGPLKRLDGLLVNLARAGWYSTPIHNGWLAASERDADVDVRPIGWVDQLRNASSTKMIDNQAANSLPNVSRSVGYALPGSRSGGERLNGAKRCLRWDDRESAGGGPR